MARSFLEFDGVYDKNKRYIVSNWSAEDFTQHFGEESAYNDNKVIQTTPAYDLTIKAGEIRELGQFEAYTFTKHFVDREIYKAAAKLVVRQEVERGEMAVNNPESRRPYEEKTIQEVKPGENTSFMDKMREEIRKEELAKLQAPAVPVAEVKEEKEAEPVTEFEEAKK